MAFIISCTCTLNPLVYGTFTWFLPYYKSTLARVSEAEPAEVADIIGRFRQEYSANDSLSRHMRENIASVDKHLKAARSQGIAALDQKQICRDIIPDVHLKALPLKKREGR